MSATTAAIYRIVVTMPSPIVVGVPSSIPSRIAVEPWVVPSAIPSAIAVEPGVIPKALWTIP